MGSSTERACSAVLAVKLNLKRQLEPDRGIVQLPDAEISTDIPTTTMDQIIIDRLTEIATLVPNHISIALIHAVYPKG
jgi:hypothetical protein